MRRNLAIGCLAVMLAGPAFAQAPPETKSPPQKQVHDPDACSDTRSTVGKGGDVRSEHDLKPLSDRLARSNGVICPPEEVDLDIDRPAPGGGRMQVIPPPGTPGGDPDARPK